MSESTILIFSIIIVFIIVRAIMMSGSDKK